MLSATKFLAQTDDRPSDPEGPEHSGEIEAGQSGSLQTCADASRDASGVVVRVADNSDD